MRAELQQCGAVIGHLARDCFGGDAVDILLSENGPHFRLGMETPFRLDLTEHRHTGLAQGCSNNRFDGIERAFEREYRVLLIRYASNSNRLRAGIRHRHLDR